MFLFDPFRFKWFNVRAAGVDANIQPATSHQGPVTVAALNIKE
jgi:hypothetical protein